MVFRVILVLLALSTQLVASAPVSAEEDITIAVRPGFEGFVRAGTWLPIEVTLANQGRDIAGELEVTVDGGAERNAFGTPPVNHSVAVNLPRFSQKRYVLEAYLPAIGNDVSVRLVSAGTVVANRAAQLEIVPSGEVFCGLLARNPAALDFIPGIPLFARQRNVRLAHLDVADLPARAAALGALDCLIFSNVSTAPLTKDQATALHAWVSSGGLLIIAGGQSWQATVAGFPENLLPVRVTGLAELAALDSIVAFTGKKIDQSGPWLASRAEATDGSVIVMQGDVPLLVAARRGIGSVFYLALDATAEPMRSWSGAEAVWRYLLSNATATVSSQSAARLSASWGRAPREALGDLSDIAGPDRRPVLYLALIYFALVAPGSYFALRMLRRAEWSLWTSAALVAAASMATLWIAVDGREPELVGNKISLLRAWDAKAPALVRSYVALLSNQQIESSLLLPHDSLTKTIFQPVFTKPPSQTRNDGWTLTVREEQTPELMPASLPAGSLVSFSTDSTAPAPLISTSLSVTGRAVGGTITNKADRELRDVALLVGREIQRVGILGAGQTASVSLSLRGSSPISYLDVGNVTGQLLPADANASQRDIVEAAVNSYSSYARLDISAATVVGWLADSPLALDAGPARIRASARTLVVVSVPVHFASGETRIPADLVERRPMSATQANRARRDSLSIAAGDTIADEYTLPLQPKQIDINYVAVDFSATINGRNDALAETVLGSIYLFDWQHGEWAEMPLTFGQNPVWQGRRFVSPLGIIRTRYTYLPPDDGSKDQMDITKLDIVVGGVVR